MDFNTGGRRPDDDQSRPLYGGEAGGPVRGPAGGPGGEFNLSDPVNSFVSTVRSVVTNPVGFFAGIRKLGDFVSPLVFALICFEISAILGGLIGVIVDVAADRNVGGSVSGFIFSLILTPIFGAIFLFVWAAIVHLLVSLIVRPISTGFETTFRAVSYSSVPALISWIPLIGGLVSFVYSIVLNVLAIRETHGTTTGKAALAVLIPVVVLVFLAILLAAAIGAFVFTLLQQQ
jgi:hypothetical protein